MVVKSSSLGWEFFLKLSDCRVHAFPASINRIRLQQSEVGAFGRGGHPRCYQIEDARFPHGAGGYPGDSTRKYADFRTVRLRVKKASG